MHCGLCKRRLLSIWKVLGTNFLCIEHHKCPFSQVGIKNIPVTAELNNLWENANYIEIKSLKNKDRWERTSIMDTVSFEKK